jgi:N-formylglutamate amidohydrolase
MTDVYKNKINSKDGWWEDEGGIIQGSISRMKSRIDSMFTKYVIHIPHSGLEIPQKYKDDYLLSDDELQKNIEQYADYKTDKLYTSLTDRHDSVINPYSRLFMDPERFFDDERESMYLNHGLGWFYENAILEKKPLRKTTNKEEISKYYREHHEKLTNLVEEKLDMFGECIIIDCHSFSNERYWFHDKNLELPDICIGYDEFHKSEKVVNDLLDGFKEYDVSINTPYAGSLVPNRYYLKDKRVKSIMIEFNKKLYLEEDNITVKNRFIPFQSILGRL